MIHIEIAISNLLLKNPILKCLETQLENVFFAYVTKYTLGSTTNVNFFKQCCGDGNQ